ncbi:MAG TPA: PAS domain S-box protein, partial [Thermoanaerobaculia bacterium]|nr:PAS domain S-box protein [Thermoanaerobaculia bacterium]
MTIQTDRSPLPAASSSRLARAKAALRRFFGRTTQTRDSLRTTVAILKAQQEAMLDAILVVGLDNRVLSMNRRFLQIWGIPEPPAGTQLTDGQLLVQARDLIADWPAFIADVEYLYEHPRELRYGDTIALKDGRILSRVTVPVMTSDDVVAGRAWYFRDITEEKRADHLQSALFRIAQLSRESRNLDEFYASIHKGLAEVMQATNLYIAEYDAHQNLMTFPYFSDEKDPRPAPRTPGGTLTAHVLRTGDPMLVSRPELDRLIGSGEVAPSGTLCVDWLGVPLKTGGSTWGLIAVQTYDETKRLTERDKDVLVFVAQHVATAIEQKRAEDALRESELRYRQMFENNRAVQILLDPDTGEIVDANTAACDFYGYPREELKRMRIWEINVLGSERIKHEMNIALSKERSFFVFRHMRANGEMRDVEVHSGPVEIGGRTLLYSIIHEITERRHAEQALQQSEEKYRNIVNHAPVGILQTTREGRLITANATIARILGYDSADDMLVVDANDIWESVEERKRAWEIYEPRGSAGNLEVRWKKKDGTLVWVNISAHVVMRETGSSYVEGFIQDVTERKRGEELLAQTSAQSKAVLEAATRVSIIATDANGVITVFNAGAERMLGYRADEMIGSRSVVELHAAAEIEAYGAVLSDEFQHTIRGFDVLVHRAALEDVEEREWTYRTKDDLEKTVLVSVTALRAEDGAITGFLHVATDITERKSSEETLRQQAAAISASMDGIAILSEKLEFTYVNDALARLYGY